MPENHAAASVPSSFQTSTSSLEAADAFDSEHGGDITEGSLIDDLDNCSEDQFMAIFDQMPGFRARVSQWLKDSEKAEKAPTQSSDVTLKDGFNKVQGAQTLGKEVLVENPKSIGASSLVVTPSSDSVSNASDVAKESRARTSICRTKK